MSTLALPLQRALLRRLQEWRTELDQIITLIEQQIAAQEKARG